MYRFLDDIAIADVAFEAFGENLADLFEAVALATFEVMVNLNRVESSRTFEIRLHHSTVEGLLFDWLAELIFLKDSEGMFFSRFQVEVARADEAYTLKAKAQGEPIDPDRHPMRQDVKAPTLHMFEVREANHGWLARVVLDI